MFDKTAKLRNELIKRKNQTVLIADDMQTSEKVEVDLGGADIEIISRINAKIQCNNKDSISSLNTPEGNIAINNAGRVRIKGVKFGGVRRGGSNVDSLGYDKPKLLEGDTGSSLSLLQVTNCEELILEGCVINDAVFCGLRGVDIGRVVLINNTIQHNTYAGALFNRIGQFTAIGNDISHNGTVSDGYGYGISLSHRFGMPVDNTAVYLAGNKAIYNTRKALDFHGGVGIRVVNNYCMGQIGIMNEPGSDPLHPEVEDPDWYKRVTDILVAGNYCFMDLAWFDTFEHLAPFEFLTCGSFGSTPSFGAGSIAILNNQFKNCNVPNSRGLIWCPVNISGEEIHTVQIKDNVLWDVDVQDVKYGYPEMYDGVIHLTSGTVVPKSIDISGNIIKGDAKCGIKVPVYNPDKASPSSVLITNNQLIGNFAHPIFVDRDLNQVIKNNLLNGEKLPDMDDPFDGTLSAELNTSDASLYKDLLSINANSWQDGSVSLKVLVEAVSSDLPVKSHASYEIRAVAQNNGGTAEFIIFDPEEKLIDGASLMPVLSWEGEGNTRMLRITCPHYYTNYKIKVEISSWRIQIFTTE